MKITCLRVHWSLFLLSNPLLSLFYKWNWYSVKYYIIKFYLASLPPQIVYIYLILEFYLVLLQILIFLQKTHFFTQHVFFFKLFSIRIIVVLNPLTSNFNNGVFCELASVDYMYQGSHFLDFLKIILYCISGFVK